jgi:hypothetical protein
MNINITEAIRKMAGWCPNAKKANKEEEWLMGVFKIENIKRIKGMGFEGVLSVLHLMYAVWLIGTALWVLAGVKFFPWYVSDITFISSAILLVIGITSLMIVLNFVKSANIHRSLAVMNIVLIVVFFWYLSQSLISYEREISVFNKPFQYYTFGIISLTIFTIIVGLPNLLTLLNKPTGKRETKFYKVSFLALIIIFALLGGYYLHLNIQRDSMILEDNEEGGEYRIYQLAPGTYSMSGMSIEEYPYFLDSQQGTTGHPISENTYKAIQFFRNKPHSNVLGWWDYELEIKAADKEPVISYASEEIQSTVGRPSKLYDRFESNTKVSDVSVFFTTDSEETAVSIAEKYGAGYVYISKARWEVYYQIMLMTSNPGAYQNIYSSEASFKEFYEQSIAYMFKTGMELEYFDKIFENEDVVIYQLK